MVSEHPEHVYVLVPVAIHVAGVVTVPASQVCVCSSVEPDASKLMMKRFVELALVIVWLPAGRATVTTPFASLAYVVPSTLAAPVLLTSANTSVRVPYEVVLNETFVALSILRHSE